MGVFPRAVMGVFPHGRGAIDPNFENLRLHRINRKEFAVQDQGVTKI
jgi:hypothetical protein